MTISSACKNLRGDKMTIKQELIEYSAACVNGEIISGEKHKWACERFLKDIEDETTFYWNEEDAQKIVDWFSYLYHSKGVLAGQPIQLTTWQKFFLCQIYGFRRKKDGAKRFRKSFVEVGRKNAKSQMLAGVALYEMCVQSNKNNELYEVYCAGTKREQSKIIFDEAKNLLKGSKLTKYFKQTNQKIECIKTKSFLKPLNKEDGKKGDGTNPALLILDEYHQHATTEFYDLGLGSNVKEPLLMIITTAGMDLNYPCYTQEYKYCSEILDPKLEVENDEYFVDILEIDKDDDISDMNNWKKANPIRMSYEKGVETIEDSYKIAQDIPEKMTAFITKCLNRWVESKKDGYMNMTKWKECVVNDLDFDIKGNAVYVGFDMSAKIDLTSVAFVIPIDESTENGYLRRYVVFSHSFIPNEEKLRERIFTDKQPYDLWTRNGYITLTHTPVVDQNAVIRYVEEFCKEKELSIKGLCFDAHNSSKLMLECEEKGYSVYEVYQSHRSLNESTSGFREEVYLKNVIVPNNPVLNYAMANAILKVNEGFIKIDKSKSTSRVDPVDAVLCGFKLAFYHENNMLKNERIERSLKLMDYMLE